MKVEIGKIKVAARIRKQATMIEELAADIERNGLLNPVTVMRSGGEYQLLAGLRRLRAAQVLGWTEIDVNEVPPKDAEEALRIEHSENEQRVEFTLAERVDYGRLIEEIERAKAKERMLAGKKVNDPQLARAEGCRQTRDVVGQKIGMSGQTYQRASYVASHAAPEVFEQIDAGEKSINGVYKELRAAEKASAPKPAAAPIEPPKPAPAPTPAPAPAAKPLASPPKLPVEKPPKTKKTPPPAPVPEPVPPPETPLERAVRVERELEAMK